MNLQPVLEKFEQPQNCLPAFSPCFAVRRTNAPLHRGALCGILLLRGSGVLGGYFSKCHFVVFDEPDAVNEFYSGISFCGLFSG